jgi:excisionase family DNA binding protein
MKSYDGTEAGTTTSPYMTVEEVAEYLRCDVKTVYRYRGEGKLKTYRRAGPRGDLLFRKEDIERLVLPEGVESEYEEDAELEEIQRWLQEGLPEGYDPSQDPRCQLHIIEGDFPHDLSQRVDDYLYGEKRI